jgi:predicted aspartyl protease
MIHRLTVSCLLFEALAFSQGPTQVSLPQCQDSLYLDRCSGTRTYANGDKYIGDFHENLESGKGTYIFANGKYVGELRDGVFSGRGIETFANGDNYDGEFRLSMFNGQGTLTYAEGNNQVLELHGGSFDGRGAYLIVDGRKFVNRGDKYVGEFHDNYANGQGTYTLANGDKYVGAFRNGTFNGEGTYTFSNGTKQAGEFMNGVYAELPKQIAPSAPKFGTQPSSGPVTAPPRAGRPFEVALRQRNGVLLVPVLINNTMSLDFIIDSGASDVTVPPDVVLALMRAGTLTKADFLGTHTYILADGSKVPSQTFRIKSLKVGDTILENVVGSVGSGNGTLLLGQSFLSRFSSWSIDNTRKVLLLR